MLWSVSLLVISVMVAGLAYTIYALSPEGRWRIRWNAAARQIRQHLRAAEAQVRAAQAQWSSQQKRILADGAARLLAEQDVKELERFPGIGRKTVEQLRQAGLCTVGEVYAAPYLPATLKNRAGLVRAAVDQWHQRLQQELLGNPQQLPAELYREYQFGLNLLEQERAFLDQRLRLLRQLHNELQKLREKYEAASSLWAFLQRLCQGKQSALPTDVLNHPLFDVESQLLQRERDLLTAPDSQTNSVPTDPVGSGGMPGEAPSRTGVADQSQSPSANRAGASTSYRRAPVPPPAPTPPVVDRLDLEIGILYMLARVDGRLSQRERDWIAGYCRRELIRDQVSANRVGALCAHYEKAPIDAESLLRRLSQCAADARWRQAWPRWFELAQVSGNAGERKRELLTQLARLLKLPAPNWEVNRSAAATAKDQSPGSSQESLQSQKTETGTTSAAPAVLQAEEARRILRLPVQGPLTAEKIREHYQASFGLYDPEKERSKGPEFVELAQRKRARIRAAAMLLLRNLGIAEPERYLDEPPQPKSDISRDNPELDAIFGV